MTTLTVVCVGVLLTISPLAHPLGFTPLPLQFFAALVGFVVAYLILVELTKKLFYAEPMRPAARRIAPAAANIASTGAPRGSVITASRPPSPS